MRKLVIYYLFLLLPSFAVGQNAESRKYLDILKAELANSKADTNRVLLLAELCTIYQYNNNDSLGFYSKQGLELAKQLQFHKGGVRILNSQGIAFAFRGNAPEALAILFKALRIAEDNKLPFETANCLNTIGASYWFLNDFTKANDFINRAVKIDETIQHTPSDIYWRILIQVWSGLDFIQLNKLDSANIILKKAYDNAFKPEFTDYSSIRPTILMFLGVAQSKLGNKEAALNYLHQSIEGFKIDVDNFGMVDACSNIAEIFKDMKQRDSVIYYSKLGLDVALKIDYKPTILRISKMLAEQYETTDTKQANKYLQMALAVNDSLYGANKIQELQKTLFEEQRRQQLAQELQTKREYQLKQYGFGVGLGVLSLVGLFLYRNNRQKQKANELLQKQKDEIDEKSRQLEKSLFQLKATQTQLIQSEKLASLGELTAGIAHEIQNPLNFVNNFSELSNELIDEMNEEIGKGNTSEVKAISSDIKSNLEKINHHGKRASSIVKGMLEHSRASTGVKELIDINKLADEYLRLSYHGMRAKDNSFNADFSTEFDENLPKIEVIPQDMGRVLLNLINNAFYAVNQRKLLSTDESYTPSVSVTTHYLPPPLGAGGAGSIVIKVKDNGIGMPESVKARVFQPFFTTKPTGSGTGLGLSLAYDIVTKGHGGSLEVESIEGIGTTFIVTLSH